MDVIKDWAILEADFTREYGINLVTARLSWRRFLILANGLSPNSLWTITFQGKKSGDVAIEDDEVSEKLFDRF
jgi:hypothetical protein